MFDFLVAGNVNLETRLDVGSFVGDAGRLLRVDTSTGDRLIVSAEIPSDLKDIALEGLGSVLVTDPLRVWRVNLETGTSSLVSGCPAGVATCIESVC